MSERPYKRCTSTHDGRRCTRNVGNSVENGGHTLLRQDTRLGLPLPIHEAEGVRWTINGVVHHRKLQSNV